MSRRKTSPTLDEVYDAYRSSNRFDHLRRNGIKLVPGYGCAHRPAVMVLGEAPGATENLRGRPFCGPSGRVLSGLMESAGLRPVERTEWADDGIGNAGDVVWAANAWITNTVKYHPLGNRTPTRAEIEDSRPYVRNEWNALGRPPVIVGVGAVAKECIHEGLGALSSTVGNPVLLGDRSTYFVPMFHPAYGLRRASVRPQMQGHWESFGEWLLREGIIDEFGNTQR